MKAIKAVATIHTHNGDEHIVDTKEAILPSTNDVLGASEMSVEMFEDITGTEVTLTKVIQAADRSSIELEYHRKEDGKIHLSVVGTTVEVDEIPQPELPAPLKAILEKVEQMRAEEQLMSMPKSMIN